MTNRIDRRGFLRRTAGGALSASLAPSLSGLVAWSAGDAFEVPVGTAAIDYGPLVEAGPELALPAGFQYARFAVGGSPMTNGSPTPGAHDGMACFPWQGARGETIVRLIRNHELWPVRDNPAASRAPGDPARAYDPGTPGGTSTLEFRLVPGAAPELRRSWMSLTGTMVNCAGGPTPWGSWLSCEETIAGTADGLDKDHGYIFEVPVAADSPTDAVPLKAMGRFVHEAIAVDPRTKVVYLTEDRGAAGFYRFIPQARGGRMQVGALREGGTLQMLAVHDAPKHDTRKGQTVGTTFAVHWVDIAEPDPKSDLSSAVFGQGASLGGATFARLEGAWWGDDSVYFHATSGGDAGLGQVWRYRPGRDLSGGRASDGGQLTLVYESKSRDVLAAPDNITMSPRGGLVLCEDTAGTCHLRGLSPRGEIFTFARNVWNEAEFAGACFSPDGSVLFVNIQGGTAPASNPKSLGMTLAIWGPWENGAL